MPQLLLPFGETEVVDTRSHTDSLRPPNALETFDALALQIQELQFSVQREVYFAIRDLLIAEKIESEASIDDQERAYLRTVTFEDVHYRNQIQNKITWMQGRVSYYRRVLEKMVAENMTGPEAKQSVDTELLQRAHATYAKIVELFRMRSKAPRKPR